MKRLWILLLGAWVVVAPASPLLAERLRAVTASMQRLRTNYSSAVVRPTIPAPGFQYDAPPFNGQPPPSDAQSCIPALEATLRKLLSQYTDKHPDVISTQRQLDELLRKLKIDR